MFSYIAPCAFINKTLLHNITTKTLEKPRSQLTHWFVLNVWSHMTWRQHPHTAYLHAHFISAQHVAPHISFPQHTTCAHRSILHPEEQSRTSSHTLASTNIRLHTRKGATAPNYFSWLEVSLLWYVPCGASHNCRMCLTFTGFHAPVIIKHGFCLGHRVFHTIR